MLWSGGCGIVAPVTQSLEQNQSRAAQPTWLPSRWEDAAVGDADGDGSDGGFVMPVGTVTFLLTDIEGSTRRWEAEPQVMGPAVARHYEILDEVAAAHGGVRPQEQGEGDSVVVAFSRARDAIGAAVAVSEAFAAEAWPTTEPVRVRMAVHTGDAQLRDSANYFGQTIIRTARIRAVGHGGQILVSGATRDLVVDGLDAHLMLVDLGEHRLKDLGRPERIWQLDRGSAAAFPALRSLDAHPNNLPVQLTTFIGRRDDVARACVLVGESRLLTLTGSGGAGKTRLALQAAAELVDDFDGGVWVAELAPLSDAALVAATVAAVLGVQDPASSDPVALIKAKVSQPTLLVLDNCEHLLDASSELVDRLLRECPALTVLATSRSPLEVPGETSWQVPAMELPPTDIAGADERQSIEVMRTFDAVRLFVDRARKARPTFVLDDDNAAAVAAICQRLEGIPLAIELAAARVRVLSPGAIVAGLDEGFRMLGAGARTALPRQQTLEASIAWSYDLLHEDEGLLLRRLGVFAGGFTLEAAEQVAADDQLDPYLVLDLLARLVDRSLVVTDDDATSARFHLLETIRQYALARLDETDDPDQVRARHLEFFVQYAATAVPVNDVVVTEPAVLAELDNIRAALAFAHRSRSDASNWAELADLLSYLPSFRCRPDEAIRWIERVLAATCPPDDRARALLSLGRCQFTAGLLPQAFGSFEQAASAAAELGDRSIGDAADVLRAKLLLYIDPAAARELLVGPASAPDAFTRTFAAITVAEAWLWQDHLRQCFDALDLAEPDVDTLGSQVAAAQHANLRAGAYMRSARFDDALRWGDLARELSTPIGGDLLSASLLTLASTKIMRGGGRESAEEVDQAMTAARNGGVGATQPMIALVDGYRRMHHDDIAGAIIAYQTAIDEATALGAPGAMLFAYLNLGLTLVRAGDTAGAAAQAQLLRHHASLVNNDVGVACADHLDGEICLAAGDRPRAEQLMHAALEVQHRELAAIHTVITLDALAALHVDADDLEAGVRLLAGADRARHDLGYRWQPSPDAARAARSAKRARDALGDDRFEQTWAEGRSMDLDAVVTYAQRARGERGRPTSGWDSLTGTELQVVAHVAEGLTNPQVAERMFISRDTVKTHLAHIYAKVGIRSRTQLATLAARQRLTRPAP
jgi:predicted ATPase/class 3 adenylate cyclase/DNA-binding CsgD family transcriptional regulator